MPQWFLPDSEGVRFCRAHKTVCAEELTHSVLSSARPCALSAKSLSSSIRQLEKNRPCSDTAVGAAWSVGATDADVGSRAAKTIDRLPSSAVRAHRYIASIAMMRMRKLGWAVSSVRRDDWENPGFALTTTRFCFLPGSASWRGTREAS